MENNSIIKGTLNLDDLPFLKDYDQLKTRLSIRLNSPTRVKPDTVTMPFRDLSITFHIDVSDVVGKENASCTAYVTVPGTFTVPIVPVVHESQHVQAGIWVHLGHLYAFSTVDGNNRGHILCLALIGFH